jgi:outer membrane protein assembly factor BamB
MQAISAVKRWLAIVATVAVFVTALSVARLTGGAREGVPTPEQPKQAAGWPMFGGAPSRNMVNLGETGLPVEWQVADEDEPRKNVKWVAELGGKVYGGPVISGGRVFIGTNNQRPRDKKDIDPKTGRPRDLGVMMCFRESDGKFLWQAVHPTRGGRVNNWPLEGLPSMPIVEGDRLYYVSNRCEVVCADVATGKAHWTLDMIKELGVFPHNMAACSPLIVGERVFVVTANGVDEDHINIPAPAAPSFLAVNKRTGKVAWQDNSPSVRLTQVPRQGEQLDFLKGLVNRAELLQHGQWSNPAYAVAAGQKQVIFPGGDGWIRAFDPDAGKLLWKFDCNPKDAEFHIGGNGTRSDFIATPVIYKDRVYIGVGQDPEHEPGVGHLWCIDMTKRGDVSRDLVIDNTVWPPKTQKNPNSAMVWHYGGPIADPKERQQLRRSYYFGRTMSTCAIHAGICYAADMKGILHCLNAQTGQPYWTHDTRANVWSSPFYADGKVYLTNDAGDAFVFAHGKEKKILAQNEIGRPARGMPVALNGVLYVAAEGRLYALAEARK